MPEAPDFRSSPMETAEGAGKAVARWEAFRAGIPDDVYDAAYSGTPLHEAPEDIRAFFTEKMPKWAKERSELMGFWLSWHLAGGFQALEASGWHRATIFRKVRRFRAEFGQHPDEFEFPWIKLDLTAAWMNELLSALGHPSATEPQ